jgi:hypothetical protein
MPNHYDDRWVEDENEYRPYPAWFPYMLFGAGAVLVITCTLL